MKHRNKKRSEVNVFLGVTLFTAIILALTVHQFICTQRIKHDNLDSCTGNYSFRRVNRSYGYITMENGERYCISLGIKDRDFAVVESLYQNQDKKITITALPSNFLRADNGRVISVTMEGTTLLDAQIMLSEYRGTSIVFFIVSIPVVVFWVLGIIISIWAYEPSKKKQKNSRNRK